MTTKLLQHEAETGVHVLTFNRPAAHNALDLEMMFALREAILRLGEEPELRAVILTGAGGASFCSGGDLQELRTRTSEADALEMITLMGDALLALERLPVPVIAAINGYALGGGSEVALACDLRIVDEKVRMGMVQARMGVTPGWGGGQRLLRTVGYTRALEILLRGQPMHAPQLRELGLVNEVVEEGRALEAALGFARRIARTAPEVVRGIKALLQAGLRQSYEEALQSERAIFPPLWAGPAHLEAVEDFFRQQAQKTKDSGAD